MAGRYNFDRVADVYEETRRLPPLVLKSLAEQIAEAFGSGRVLDAGTGTGRFAEAVEAHGLPVIGVDIGRRMLRQARDRGLTRLVQADVAHLPLRDRSVDHALAFGLLHFLPEWRRAIQEVARVIRTFLAATTGGATGTEIGQRYRQALLARGWDPDRRDGISIDALAERLPPALRFPRIAHEKEERTDDLIDRFANRVFTWQWAIPEDVHRTAMEGLREKFGGRTFLERRTWELLVWRVEDLGRL